MGAPARLRVEHLGNAALGLGEAQPRLSWWLPAGAERQQAYAVEVNGQDLGRVDSPEQVLVPWPGDPVGSRQRVEWRVKVWTDGGESAWSAPAWFETGLLAPADWVARWIEPYEPEVPPPGERPAYLLRHRFTLDTPVGDARLHATAHGIYETYLNGVRVGDCELTPGFTSYQASKTFLVGEGSAMLTRRLGRSWGFGLGPVITLLDESFSDDSISGKMERRKAQVEIFGGLRYEL